MLALRVFVRKNMHMYLFQIYNTHLLLKKTCKCNNAGINDTPAYNIIITL